MTDAQTTKQEKRAKALKEMGIPEKVAVSIEQGPSQSNVFLKLIGFSLLLFIVPISSFFLFNIYFFKGRGEIPSAIISVVLANVVMFAYVMLAFNEDGGAAKKISGKDKKTKRA